MRRLVEAQEIEHKGIGWVRDENGIHMVQRLYHETLPNGVKHDILKATDEGEANNTPEFLVPPDHLFAMGDNRDNSQDSRFMNYVGFVPVENLVGRAEIIFFSIDENASAWKIWEWPETVRWNRIFQRIK